MDFDTIHQEVEEYISQNVPAEVKYSLTPNNARDFSLPEAPLLEEGVDPFIVFDVELGNNEPASVGNTARRSVGVVNIEVRTNRQQSRRAAYKLLKKVTPFLNSVNHNGIRLQNLSGNGRYEDGNWNVDSFTVPFNVTRMLS